MGMELDGDATSDAKCRELKDAVAEASKTHTVVVGTGSLVARLRRQDFNLRHITGT